MWTTTNVIQTSMHSKALFHMLFAGVALCVLCVAGIQAALVALQDHQLHHRYVGKWLRRLPPLETMESVLFRMLWMGFLLLTFLVVTSFYAFHDMLSGMILSKVIFTLFAWSVFAVLLGGRYFLGWRGRRASVGALVGVTLLVVTYFGSQWIVESLL